MHKQTVLSSFLLTIGLLLCGCQSQFKDEYNIDNCSISNITSVDTTIHLDKNDKLGMDIKNKIMQSKKIKGPVKGYGIGIVLRCNNNDTMDILSYGGSEYFKYKRGFYKAEENIFPDSIKAVLKKHPSI